MYVSERPNPIYVYRTELFGRVRFGPVGIGNYTEHSGFSSDYPIAPQISPAYLNFFSKSRLISGVGLFLGSAYLKFFFTISSSIIRAVGSKFILVGHSAGRNLGGQGEGFFFNNIFIAFLDQSEIWSSQILVGQPPHLLLCTAL